MAAQSNSHRSPTFLRLTLGFVYFHFGLLKFFPDLSPAEMLSTQTVMVLTNQWLSAADGLLGLAILETLIGIGLLFNVLPRITFGLFLGHMVGAFMPLFVLPELTFKVAPFAPNVEGQYIFKNLVFVAAGWTVLLPEIRRRPSLAVQAPRQTQEMSKNKPAPRPSPRANPSEAPAPVAID